MANAVDMAFASNETPNKTPSMIAAVSLEVVEAVQQKKATTVYKHI
jgi:hypothetical protein